MIKLHRYAYFNGLLLAGASAISIVLGGCGEQTVPAARQQTEKLTPEQEFFELLKKAEAGDVVGQAKVAISYANGVGVTKDVVKAFEWETKAANQGNPVAQRNLGISYYTGEGVLKDLTKAYEWWQKAASQGDAESQVQIGLLYANGFGVPKDSAKAIEWFRKAAELGSARGQARFGLMHYIGEGIPQDLSVAVEWMKKAAAQGDSDGQTTLAYFYANGLGIPKDNAKAAEWWQKAATQGNPNAMTNLGWAYAAGEGVSRDFILAYAWANLGASQGNKGGAENRDIYERQLSPAEKAEAQRLSSNWKMGQILARENQPASTSTNSTVPSGNMTKVGTGTAFIVSNTGQAITNHHVIDGCREVRAEGREGVVKVTTSDVVNDLALLQISGAVNALAAINSELPPKFRLPRDGV